MLMALTKGQGQQQENALIKALTIVCETAKAQVPGFKWLTHDHDQNNFPKGLRVIWIFDNQQTMDHAIQTDLAHLMRCLTQEALSQAKLNIKKSSIRITFDNEQACLRVDHGDWQKRLARTRQII